MFEVQINVSKMAANQNRKALTFLYIENEVTLLESNYCYWQGALTTDTTSSWFFSKCVRLFNSFCVHIYRKNE